MIVRWMRQMKKIRPWMVAVALACGAPLGTPACGGGGDDSGRDVPLEVTESAEDGAATDDATAQDDVTSPDEGSTTDEGADCTPATFYGPLPCTDDAQCVAENGAGWTCTGTMSATDSCGNPMTWGPFCEPPSGADADADAPDGTWYGPPPADADANDTPSNMYGPPADVEADADDVPAMFYGPPPP
jgi:hypothetical protein